MIEFLGQKVERMHIQCRKERAQSGGLPALPRRVNRGVNNGSREIGKEESSLQQPAKNKKNNKHLRLKQSLPKQFAIGQEERL